MLVLQLLTRSGTPEMGPIMHTTSALTSPFGEARERASQRILMASALVAGIAGVTSFAVALLVVAVPA
jgi:hypothetical protein